MGTAQFRSLRIFRMLLLSYAIANAGWATGPRRHASRESQISPGRDKNDRADHVLLLTQSGSLLALSWKLSHRMATEDFYRYRGAVGSLIRSCSADDPKLVHARAAMAEETLVDASPSHWRRPPPLAPQARERVIALLSAHPVAQWLSKTTPPRS